MKRRIEVFGVELGIGGQTFFFGALAVLAFLLIMLVLGYTTEKIVSTDEFVAKVVASDYSPNDPTDISVISALSGGRKMVSITIDDGRVLTLDPGENPHVGGTYCFCTETKSRYGWELYPHVIDYRQVNE